MEITDATPETAPETAPEAKNLFAVRCRAKAGGMDEGINPLGRLGFWDNYRS